MQLVKDCEKLYEYFKTRGIHSLMTLPPTKNSIKSVISGLGYTTQSFSKAKDSSKQELAVNLTKKQNQREQLSLFYYSIGVGQHLVLDFLICKILFHLNESEDNVITKEKLEEQVEAMGHVFRYEYTIRDPSPIDQMIQHRINALSKFGEIQFN